MKTNKNIVKKVLSALILITMLVSSMPGTVLTSLAASTGVSYITRSWNASSKTVSSATKSAQATEVTANDSVWGEDGKVTYYVVNSVVTSTQDIIEVHGEVHLILNQKFSMSGRIVVQENGALHIHEAANAQNATIEVDYIWSKGTVVAIHGGTVTTPREYGTRRRGLEIRSGDFYLYSGTVNGTIGAISAGLSSGSILIYGGTVNAYAYDAQGLIGADNGPYESIEIYNATIKGNRTAEALYALIGGKEVGKIIIHNSNIDVDYDGYEGTRGNQTHGIGGGSSDNRISEITITNSTVSVWGGGSGSGIGGYVDTITLKDSTVRAFAGDYSMPKGIGIGGKYCNEILIDGGSVMTDTANDAYNWKGKGYYAKNITVKKGTVDAHEGLHLNGGSMVITGGNVLGTISGATPVNSDGTTLYARQITLSGAVNDTAVSAITGVPSYYNLSGMRTIGSDICVWVPSTHVPSVISLGSDQYGGAMIGGAANQTATFGKLHTCVDNNNDGLCDHCEEIMPPNMENGFYLIYDLEDYQYLKKLVEGTLKSGLANRKANAKLMANINIGDTTIGTVEFPYGGVFDGNFKTLTVTREYRDRNGTDPVAPFLYADGATFKRLTMEGSIYVDHYNRQIKTTDIGGFVAITTGNPVTFEQCVNKATVEANNYTGPTVNLGGFVGKNYTTLTFNNCASLGKIETSRYSGGSGFVGDSDTTSPVYVNDSYIYLTMAVAGNNADANSYFCRNEDYTFLTNTYVCITMQRYNGNQGWINAQNRKNKDGTNDITNVKEAQINDGTVTYKLNKGNANGIWKQTLTGENPDKYPVFSGANVVQNLTNDKYDNHNHNPKYELATVNVKNDSVRVTCAGCAPDGICITVSIKDGTTYSWYNDPEATITHPNLVDFYYMEGDTILKCAPTDAGNYTVNFEYGGIKVSVPYSILPRSIEKATVRLNGNLIYSGKEQSAPFTLSDSGTLKEGEDYTLSNHKQTDVGTYEVTITGIGNYTGTRTATFSIIQASNWWITKPSIEDWTYGEEPNAPVYKAKYGTPTIRYTGNTNGGEAYDSDKIPTQAGQYKAVFTVNDKNYKSLSTTVTFVIHKAALTVTADDKTITYGDKAPDYTVSYEGFVNGDDKEELGGTLITNCAYSQFDDKGTYNIIPSGYTSDNYEFIYNSGTLTVNPKPITVTIHEKSSIYGEELVELTGFTDGIENEDTNVYKLATTASKVSDVGNYDIKGETVDANYSITFKNEKNAYVIQPRELSIELKVANKQYDGLYDATIESAILKNLANEDEVELINGMATFVSVNVAEDIAIQFTEFTLVGESEVLKNYSLIQPKGITANIYNNWIPSEYMVSTPNINGWLQDTFVITAAEGYKVSLTDTADGAWNDSLKYTEETENSSVIFYLKKIADGTISLGKTVTYKLDKTAPTGKVEFVERSSWQEFVNTITFNLFYKDEVSVKVTPTDNLSNINKIEYASADEDKTLDEVKAITDWTEYNDSFGVALEDAKKFVYFVRITDNAGNVTYLSTDGAEYDTTAPVFTGIENGKTYYTTQKVTVDEKNIDTVIMNGNPASKTITLEGNKEATYTIVVKDKADNEATVTVTMKPISQLSVPIDTLTKDNVNSSNEQVIDDVKEAVAAIDITNATEEEKAALKDIVDKADGLEKVIEDAIKSTNTENIEKVEDITVENVTPEDKTDLKKAKEDLEKAKEDNVGNYTEDEKKAIEEEIKRIDAALEVIGKVEAVEELISKLPENIKKSDEDVIKAADEAFNTLTDYQKNLVDKDVKKALDDAKATLAELNKPADSNTPATDDNSSLWLWFALLFASDVGIFGIFLAERKRKVVNKM